MLSSVKSWTVLVWIAMAIVGGGVARAQDESPAELRKRLEVAEANSARLEAELERVREERREARLRVRELEAELRQLRADLAEADETIAAMRTESGQRDVIDPTTPPAPDGPLDAMRSPGTMLAVLRQQYETEIAGLPLEGKREQEAYRDLVQSWIERVKTELRGRATWLVRVEDVEPADRRGMAALRLAVLDDVAGEVIDAPVVVTVRASQAKQITDATGGTGVWRLSGVFAPSPIYAPDRDAIGTFDYPPFIGRYAEFGYTFDVRSIDELSEIDIERLRDEAAQEETADDAETAPAAG